MRPQFAFAAKQNPRFLPLKNQLSSADAQAVEMAFEARLSQPGEAAPVSQPKIREADGPDRDPVGPDAQSTVERELVLRLASLFWRLRRATAIEGGEAVCTLM